MTAQAFEPIEYQNIEYCFLGISSGQLFSMSDLEVNLPSDHIHVGSTGLVRGFRPTYAITSDNKLIIKRVSIPDVTTRVINQKWDFTGHIIFGTYDCIHFLFRDATAKDLTLYEAGIVNGVVQTVDNITVRTLENLTELRKKGWVSQMSNGTNKEALKQFEQHWAMLDSLLPQHYEVLRVGGIYNMYSQIINYLKKKTL